MSDTIDPDQIIYGLVPLCFRRNGANVRVLDIDAGGTWFVAADVAKLFRLPDPVDAAARLCSQPREFRSFFPWLELVPIGLHVIAEKDVCALLAESPDRFDVDLIAWIQRVVRYIQNLVLGHANNNEETALSPTNASFRRGARRATVASKCCSRAYRQPSEDQQPPLTQLLWDDIDA